jgi:hypothetical protein
MFEPEGRGLIDTHALWARCMILLLAQSIIVICKGLRKDWQRDESYARSKSCFNAPVICDALASLCGHRARACGRTLAGMSDRGTKQAIVE